MRTVSRRAFLVGASALAASAAMPLPVASVPLPPTAAPLPKLLAFAVGTEGEFNWQPFFAASKDEAMKLARAHFGYDDPEDEYCSLEINRVEKWDHRGDADNVTAADWLRAGMGHVCDRCSDETFYEESAIIVGEVVVCGECTTLSERIQHDPDWALDELADRIADEGEEEARWWVERAGAWSVAEPLWARAVEQAK